MAEKRKRVVLTIQQKLEIVNKLEKGISTKAISLEYDIGKSTVRDIFNRKDKLLSFATSSDSFSVLKKRKSMKQSAYEEIDKALIEWVAQQKAQGEHVSGPMITNKAKYFFETLGFDGKFNASSGWLTRFKQRYGIGEKASEDTGDDEEFKEIFQNLLQSENVLFEQVNETDESGLLWNYLLNRKLLLESGRHEKTNDETDNNTTEKTEITAKSEKRKNEPGKSVQKINAEKIRETIDENKNNKTINAEILRHEMALQHIDGLLEYLEEQNNVLLTDKSVLRKLQSEIKQKCSNAKNQLEVT